MTERTTALWAVYGHFFLKKPNWLKHYIKKAQFSETPVDGEYHAFLFTREMTVCGGQCGNWERNWVNLENTNWGRDWNFGEYKLRKKLKMKNWYGNLRYREFAILQLYSVRNLTQTHKSRLEFLTGLRLENISFCTIIKQFFSEISVTSVWALFCL